MKAGRLREEGAETGGQKNGRHSAGFLYCRAFFGCLFAGSLFLFASPGSRERLFEAQRDSPADNFRLLMQSVCSDQMRFFIFLLLTAGMVSAAWLLVSSYKEKHILHCSGEQDDESRHGAGFHSKRRFRIPVLIFGISVAAFAAAASGILLTGGGLTAVYQRMLRVLGLEKLNPLGDILLPAMLLAALSEIMLVLIKKRSVVPFVYAAGASVSFLCILPSPGFASRMLLPSALFLIPSLNTVLRTLLSVRKRANDMVNDRISSFAAIISPALLAVLLSAGGMNQNSIMEGYYRNSESEEYNTSVLENYDSNKDENGLVTLKKHWDDSYGNMMPYMEGYEWIEGYMKTMYDLPENAVFRWEGEDCG